MSKGVKCYAPCKSETRAAVKVRQHRLQGGGDSQKYYNAVYMVVVFVIVVCYQSATGTCGFLDLVLKNFGLIRNKRRPKHIDRYGCLA